MIDNVYLSLGSNLGDKKANLEQAIHFLSKDNNVEIKHISHVYQTKPVGEVKQEDFYNCCMAISTKYSPQQLLELIHIIELKLLRTREVFWGPRTIDIDIILFKNMKLQETNLIIPHQEMHNRLFVLVPLLEIIPKNSELYDRMNNLLLHCQDTNKIDKLTNIELSYE